VRLGNIYLGSKILEPCLKKTKTKYSQALVAHACNPSYLGSRDHEDQGSKPAWGNSSVDLISKIIDINKTGLVEWLKW
jgi:hypothetical protein